MADNEITLAAPPTTAEAAQMLLASLAAQSGVLTDYNKGSQIRTWAEAFGAVAEISGVSALTLALQVIAYGAMSLFDISPNMAVPSTCPVLFATALSNAPPAVQDIPIPAGTLLQTLRGVQFATASGVTLLAGATGITATVVATDGGLNTNVPVGAISQLLSGLIAPLVVYNQVPATGGLDAETPAQALTRLAAKFNSLVGGSPVSVANSAIGVTASGSSEKVLFSTCYEGWRDPASANYPSTAGFDLYVDNGAGVASQALLDAVRVKLDGNINNRTPAFRPAGVPNAIRAVAPVRANVVVSGTPGPLTIPANIKKNISDAISRYFTLPFGAPAERAALSAVVANAALGQLSELQVDLYYATAPGASVALVTGAAYTRVILNSLTISGLD